MEQLLPHPKILFYLAYPFLALVLIAYNLYAHYRKHEMKLPVGFIILYALVIGAMRFIVEFDLPSVLSILNLLSTIFLTLAIIRLLVFIFVDYLMRHKGLAQIPVITRDIGLAVVYVAAILVILRYQANVNLASLITTSAVVTAVIGFALQDTLGNLFAGIVLQIEKPYNIDDWIKFDNYVGQVVGISWKSTRIVTRENEMVCIPNSVISKGNVQNFSFPGPHHVATFQIGTSYNDAPNVVREAILATLSENSDVLKIPAPEVRVVSYDDFSINYLVRFCVSDFACEEKIKSSLKNQLWYRFKRDGIVIPFPIRTIQHAGLSAEKEAVEKSKKKSLTITSLKKVDIFMPLSDEDFGDLAERVGFERYASGESVIYEGAAGDSMYVIVSGEADIVISDENKEKHLLATLKDGQFFGEMSLLTGEPRTATVCAKTDMLCVKIEKGDMDGVLRRHPAVAESISSILAERRLKLTTKREEVTQSGKQQQSLAAQLLSKIRSYFNI